MRVLDASSALHAWDNYPATQFPGLWFWLAGEMQHHRLAIPAVAIGVEADADHPNGVDENDVLIIASAKVRGAELVTNEGRQFGKQAEARKSRIPAVCDMPAVGVVTLNFLEYIQKSQQVFG